MTPRRALRSFGAALVWLAVPAALVPAFADPYDYRDRRDTITSSAGNANAANIATHSVDPWPRHARNRTINLDGQRAGLAIARYKQNRSIPPKGLENAGPDLESDGKSGASAAK